MEEGLLVLVWLERQQNMPLFYGIRYVEAFEITSIECC